MCRHFTSTATRGQLRSDRKSLADSIEAGPGRIDSQFGLAKLFGHNPLNLHALKLTHGQLRSERKSLADSIEDGPGRIDSHFGLAKMLTPEE